MCVIFFISDPDCDPFFFDCRFLGQWITTRRFEAGEEEQERSLREGHETFEQHATTRHRYHRRRSTTTATIFV